MRQNSKLRRIQLFGFLIKIHQEQVKLDEKKRKEKKTKIDIQNIVKYI